jgi:hypothetical protein
MIASLILDQLLHNASPPPRLNYGAVFERLRVNPTLGVGRGAPGRPRNRSKKSLTPTFNWNKIKTLSDSVRLKMLIHISVPEFSRMLKDMKKEKLDTKFSGLFFIFFLL